MRQYSFKRNIPLCLRIGRWIGLLGVITSQIIACGGGGDNSGTSDALSVNKQSFEDVLSGGYYTLVRNIPAAGVTPVSGTHFVYSLKIAPNTSPSKGTQTCIPSINNLSATLALPDMVQRGIVRVVIDGKVFARSTLNEMNVSYSGDNIVFDSLASDGVTVLFSDVIDSWSAPIALSVTDTIRIAPNEVKAAIGLLTHPTDSNFDLSWTWLNGSAYIKRSGRRSVDTLFTYDWSGKTYDSNVNGSNFSGTLETFFASFPSETVTIGAVQYKIGDGEISTVSGVRAWIASTAAQASSLPTTSYYTLYEMGGSIFVGYLQKTNTRIRQVSAIDGTELLEYSVLFNDAAINSIKQIMTAPLIEFALTNQSFHPVQGEGKNPFVISLIRPYREKKISSSDVSILLCADCHGGIYPVSLSGSNYKGLLADNYSTGDSIVESSFAYALCYKCHKRSSILGNESFPSHSRHIAGERNFKGGGTSCHTCHSSHGSVENKYLIRFNREFVSESSTGKLKFVEKGTYAFHGECWLTCHGVDHNPKSY